MKRLYALLVILIVIYIGINSFSLVFNDNGADEVADVNESVITVGASNLPEIENFTDNTLNDTTVNLVNSNKNITIQISEIDNSQSISDIFNNFVSNNGISSTQTIDQNGVTTYLAYDSGSDSYNADIFFNKNGQNYCISGDNILSSDSDYFINHCKGIIDTISINSTS